jgi:hypothetical protein
MSKKIDLESFDRLLPDPNRFGCHSYLAGHNPHWIQWSHSAKETGPAKTWPGKVVTVEGEVLTVRKPDESLTRFRCHDPVRLIFILEHLGVDVAVNDRWSILRAGITEAGAFCFSVKADDGQPLGPCPIGALPSNVAGVDVRRHVGFSAPVAIDNARRDN